MTPRKIALPLLAAVLLAACSSTHSAYGAKSGAPAMMSDGILTGSNGMTLYVFDKDPAGGGKSVCNGPCANNWPPLLAATDDSASGDFSIVARDDGRTQWAYKGKPVYFWIKDQKPGDRTGDGFKDVWHVAKP